MLQESASHVQNSPDQQPQNVRNDQGQDLQSQQQFTDSNQGTIQSRSRESHIGSNLQNDVLQTFVTSSSDAIGLLFRAADQNDSDGSEGQAMGISPHLAEGQSDGNSMPSPAIASNETLSLWAHHRFVRQGWFTPREAISYVEL